MQTVDGAAAPGFVTSFALQRQRLLHHVGSLLEGGESAANPAVTQLSQMVLTSLELLKVAEDELREEQRTSATRAVVQERRIAHLAALFDHAPMALLLTATDTTIREANRAASALLGRTVHDLEGRRLSDMIPTAQRAGFKEQLAHAHELGAIASWSFNLELRRAVPSVVSATLSLIDDAAVGSRALYWSLRAA